MRHAVFQKVQSLSYAELDRLGTSTLMTRMTSDMNQVPVSYTHLDVYKKQAFSRSSRLRMVQLTS